MSILEHKIIRGLIYDPDNIDEIEDNFSTITHAQIKFRDNESNKILTFIEKFFYDMGDLPQLETLQDQFKTENLILEFLGEVASEAFFKPADFKLLVNELQEKYRKKDYVTVLKDAIEILNNGKTTGKETLKGLKDSAEFLIGQISKVKFGSGPKKKVSGNIRQDASKMREAYLEKKEDPSVGIGILCKFSQIDLLTRGVQPGELMITAAFAGHMKSTHILNMAHFNMVLGRDQSFFSLEMPFEQVRQILYCIHSGSDVFATRGYAPLEYDKIKTGTLSPEEEDFYLNYVIPDFCDNPRYGELYIHQMDGESMTPSRIKALAELDNRETEIECVYVDYLTLTKPETGLRFSSKAEAVNYCVQRMKEVALEFDNGRSVAVVSPVQINRQGLKRAIDSGGVYDLLALADYNQIEKAGDLIIAFFKDTTMPTSKEAKATPLKSRDSRVPEPFSFYANGATKQIGEFAEIGTEMGEDGLIDWGF